MPQFESSFEEKFYNDQQTNLQRIADIVRAQSPGTSDIAARYPNSFAFKHTIEQVIPSGLDEQGELKSAETLEAEHIQTAIAGRLIAIRVQGKAGFATLQQGGARLQIYVRKDDVGEPTFDLYKLLGLGDHIGVTGTLMRTRTGELTLKVQTLTFLAKTLLPLPDKHSGLGDIELRYRRRYLDLFTDEGDTTEPTTPDETNDAKPEGAGGLSPLNEAPTDGPLAPGTSAPTITRLPARTVFVKRAAILRAIRKFFDDRGYLEVETPMLHTIAGGAAARTFNTHHNAEDVNLILRIAPELHLKRLVVGGFDRVYEINRNFRNEGVDTTHNPEFTMLEFYQAYANYHDLMDLTEELIKSVAMEVNGKLITSFGGVEIDLGKWNKLTMREAIIMSWPPDLVVRPSLEDLKDEANFWAWYRRFDQAYKNPDYKGPYAFPMDLTVSKWHEEATGPWGKFLAHIFETVAEELLTQPTIIYDFPLAVSPLSKVKPDEPDWVERFEFYIGGFEVGNAFSELNDPADQLRRFEDQVADKDPESMSEVDHDYVRALGYGLPPTAGEGIGIDRLTMILTGARSIRDVILFPLMRPKTEAPAEE